MASSYRRAHEAQPVLCPDAEGLHRVSTGRAQTIGAGSTAAAPNAHRKVLSVYRADFPAPRTPWLTVRVLPATWSSFQSEYTAGITISVRTVLEIIPPTMGAAMRFMTLAPVPLPHRIGRSPAMIAVTVIIFGRTRSTCLLY